MTQLFFIFYKLFKEFFYLCLIKENDIKFYVRKKRIPVNTFNTRFSTFTQNLLIKSLEDWIS